MEQRALELLRKKRYQIEMASEMGFIIPDSEALFFRQDMERRFIERYSQLVNNRINPRTQLRFTYYNPAGESLFVWYNASPIEAKQIVDADISEIVDQISDDLKSSEPGSLGSTEIPLSNSQGSETRKPGVMSVTTMKDIQPRKKKSKFTRIVFISDLSIMDQRKAKLEEFGISIFLDENLTYNPTKHFSVPKLRKVTNAEKAKLLSEMKSLNRLPLIRHDDAMAKFQGFKEGDVIERIQSSFAVDILVKELKTYHYVVFGQPTSKYRKIPKAKK